MCDMETVREFLDPKRKLIDEVVDWLCGSCRPDTRFSPKVRTTPEGALSLEHLMVVVPTAQSGRNLRLSLARRFEGRGLVPPRIVQPMQIVVPADQSLREASGTEAVAAFLKFLDTHARWGKEFGGVDDRMSLLDQLGDIWRVLAGGGLLMGNVPHNKKAEEVLARAQGSEQQRWEDLASLEREYFEFLHAKGLRHSAESVSLAKVSPKPLPAEIEGVVLPALADPLDVMTEVLNKQRPGLVMHVLLHAAAEDSDKFDGFGRPKPECWTGNARPILQIDDADISLSSSWSGLARKVVGDFPELGSGFEFPSLALADSGLFSDVAAEFLNAGYVLHNPERHRLAVSSLGRLIRDLMSLYMVPSDGMPWEVFAALLRSEDVMSALCDDKVRAQVLEGLDFCHNRFLPLRVPEGLVFPEVEIREGDAVAYSAFLDAARKLEALLVEARTGIGLPGFLRKVLSRIFAARRPSGGGADKEFLAAADCARGVLDSLESDAVVGMGLSAYDLSAIARREIDAAAYSLEPDARDAVKTEGWLELAWSTKDRFALTGFHEGAVPDSVIGHPFIPDSLRKALGLSSNERRLARDTWLFKELLDSHPPHSVRAYVAKTNDRGDICRPSRLLFLCHGRSLPERVAYLFGECSEDGGHHVRTVSEAWRLNLPDEVPLPGCDGKTPGGRLSASAIDQYLKCPFTYLLKFGLGMQKHEEKVELGYDDFGTLVHRALEEYAIRQLDRGDRQLCDAASIRCELDDIMRTLRTEYGDNISTGVALQLDAVAGRLALFADIQAAWSYAGWRVAESPEYPFLVHPFAEEGIDTFVKGRIDRIDFHPEHGYRIIDYKTWDERSGVVPKHLLVGGEAQRMFAGRLGLPVVGDSRLLSVQLPLYAHCLGIADDKFKDRVADSCYLVLGDSAENAVVLGSAFPQGDFECQKKRKLVLAELSSVALATAKRAIGLIKAGVFWPPGPGYEWKYDIKDLLASTPERDMGEDIVPPPRWLAGQLEKLARLGNGEAGA